MKVIQYLFSNEIIEALGWTLLHSLWQGTAIALALILILLIMRNNSAQVKYFISFIALLGLLIWPALTFIHSYQYAKEKSEIREKIITSPGYIRNVLKENYNNPVIAERKEKEVYNLQLIKIRGFFQRNFNIICTFWIIGLLVFGLRLIGSIIYLRRIRTQNLIKMDMEWMVKLNDLAGRLKIRRKISTFFSPYIHSPLTLGTLKPVILFPVSVFTGFSAKEIEAILAHELAHILRHDYLLNIIQSIIETFFFYNPAVWLISSYIRTERENSCDNIAIQLTGDKVSFAKALACMQVYRVEQESLAMSFSSSGGGILNRIKRLQKQLTMKTNLNEGLIATGIIILCLTLVSFTFGDNALSRFKNDQSAVNSQNNKNTAKKDSKRNYTQQQVDSIFQAAQKNISKNEELESSDELKSLIEVALSEKDSNMSAEMLDDINNAIVEIDVDQITKQALQDAAKAIKEANRQLEKQNISENMHTDLKQAAIDLKQAKADLEESKAQLEQSSEENEAINVVAKESAELGIEAARMGIEIASSVLENLPIQEIIETSMEGVSEALKTIENTDFDSVYCYDKLTKEEKEEIKEQMIENKKELENRMKELQKQMEEIENQLGEE